MPPLPYIHMGHISVLATRTESINTQVTPLLELFLLVEEVCAPFRKRLDLCSRHIWNTKWSVERGYCGCII